MDIDLAIYTTSTCHDDTSEPVVSSTVSPGIDILRESNARLSINRLQEDVLLIIFRLYRDFFEATDTRWLSVTHVHHAWRTIALSDASLWTMLDIARPAIMEEFARRARPAHMQLYLNRLSSEDPALPPLKLDLRSLRDNFIRSVNLRGNIDDGSWNELIDVVKNSAPVISSIRLDTMRVPSDIFHRWSTPVWTSPIFHSPRLRVLRVSSSRHWDHVDSLHSLFVLLDSVPQLEELSLLGCLPLLDTNAKTAHLPSLDTLALSAPPRTCRFLQERLTRPSTCRTYMVCENTQHTGAVDYLIRYALSSPPPICGIHIGKKSIHLFSGIADGRPLRSVSLPCLGRKSSSDVERACVAIAVEDPSTLVLVHEWADYLHWEDLALNQIRVHTLFVDLVHVHRDSEHDLGGLMRAIRKGFLPELRTLVIHGLATVLARKMVRTCVLIQWSVGKILGLLRERVEGGGVFDELRLVDAGGLKLDALQERYDEKHKILVRCVRSADDPFSLSLAPWAREHVEMVSRCKTDV